MVDVTALAEGPFVVFLAMFLGVLLGEVEFRGFSLGISGVMFVGLAIGALPLALPIEVGVDPGFQNLALVLFVAAIGLLAAEDIGGVIRAYGGKFVAIAIMMTAVAAGFTNFSIALFSASADPWVVRGAFNGAVTSSPGLASMLEVAPAESRPLLSAGTPSRTPSASSRSSCSPSWPPSSLSSTSRPSAAGTPRPSARPGTSAARGR